MAAQRLPYDTLIQVMEQLHDDSLTLCYCASVNRLFNLAASKLLYVRTKYSPQDRRIFDLKDRGTLSEPSMLASARKPRYASLVTELEISGYISTRSPPSFLLSSTIADAIQLFTNLSKVTLSPVTFHNDLFRESLAILPRLKYLREVVVNSSCMNEQTAPLLVQVKGLHKLTLCSPGRVILDSLPAWLKELSPDLVGLHLKDNCGSITPGVLALCAPQLYGNLKEMTLGLSYSLTDEHVFSFLAQQPRLERLQLQYYLQLRAPKTLPRLSRLKFFTVNYTSPSTKLEASALCKWIRRVITYSPIEHISLVCDNPSFDGPSPPFDSIIHHLIHQHSRTLRILDLFHAYISVDACKALFGSLTLLEEAKISARKGILDIFQERSVHLRQLHTAAFHIRNTKMKRSLVDDELAHKIILQASTAFRRLKINGAEWEGSWKACEERDDVRFVVNRNRGLN